MSAIEYREAIARKLGQISDLELLSWLDGFLESYRKGDMIELSSEQTERVESGRRQREAGTLTSSEDFHREIEEWLASE